MLLSGVDVLPVDVDVTAGVDVLPVDDVEAGVVVGAEDVVAAVEVIAVLPSGVVVGAEDVVETKEVVV